MPKIELTPQQRRALRAAAHPLHPVVLIGDKGLTEPVLAEIDRNLSAHEIIKVHVASAERDVRDTILASLCDTLSCAAVHHIGKTLIIYRPRAQAQATNEGAARPTRRKGPYVPKKLAAFGHDARKPAPRHKAARSPKVDTSSSGRTAAAGRKSAGRDSGIAERPARPTNHALRSAAAPHGIPRRSSGSALTLRAGRRGRSTRS